MGITRFVKDKIKLGLYKRGMEVVPAENPFKLERLFNCPEVPFSEEDYQNRDKDNLTVNWVIPPLIKGAGGHMTIFRNIHITHKLGLHNRIYIYSEKAWMNAEELRAKVKEWYQVDLEEDEIFPDISFMSYADATVATLWETAYVVKNFNNTISKFYLIQDFEPYFFQVGSEYALVEDTYLFGFRGITAGTWLAEKCHNEYGMETRSFGFSYDSKYYYPREREDHRKRVFLYARPYTKRRAFEIAMIALKMLKKVMPNVEIVTAGQDLSCFDIPFDYVNKGILTFSELSQCYSDADLCLVLSMTNLSLLPLEVMASGSVVVSNRGKNNEWLLNDKNSILVSNNPVEIAEKLEYYLNNSEELTEIREYGLQFAKQFDWENEIKNTYDFISESVKKDIAEKEGKE